RRRRVRQRRRLGVGLVCDDRLGDRVGPHILFGLGNRRGFRCRHFRRFRLYFLHRFLDGLGVGTGGRLRRWRRLVLGLDGLRLGFGRRLLVGVDVGVADLLGLGDDRWFGRWNRRRSLLLRRLLVALLQLGQLVERNDVDRECLDVGHLQRARRRQREQPEA